MSNYVDVITYQDVKSFVEDITGDDFRNSGNWIEFLEKELPDSNFFVDVNLDSLIEYLTDGGYTEEEVKELNNKQYGKFVRFYYIEDEGTYVMDYGVN